MGGMRKKYNKRIRLMRLRAIAGMLIVRAKYYYWMAKWISRTGGPLMRVSPGEKKGLSKESWELWDIHYKRWDKYICATASASGKLAEVEYDIFKTKYA